MIQITAREIRIERFKNRLAPVALLLRSAVEQQTGDTRRRKIVGEPMNV